MKQITKKLFSHQSLLNGEKFYNSEIKGSDPLKVTSFQKLVELVSQITFNNPDFSIFFRGQNKDYKNSDKSSSLLPSFYRSNLKVHTKRNLRNGKTVFGTKYKLPIEELDKAEAYLLKAYKENQFDGFAKTSKFKELSWSILQHYEVCPTPLLDITHSLRVAASFALSNAKKEGFLYLLGFPHVNGSISYYVEEELLNIKLLSICPPIALRPHYQEGFTAGTFPIPMTKAKQFDFNKRLIAKFKLIKRNFWDNDFKPIPEIALYPDSNDKMKRVCDEIKEKLNSHV